MNSISIDGCEIPYIDRGSGPPLVFVHGTVSDYRSFGLQFEPFARHFHIHALSRRFHPPGPGPGDKAVYAALQHANDLAGFIRQLHLGPAHIVGSSYGAFVSLLTAITCPGIARTLVLGEPPILPLLQWSSRGRLLFDEFMHETMQPAHVAFNAGNSGEGLRIFIDGVSGRAGAFDGQPELVRDDFARFGPELRTELQTAFETYMPAIDCSQLSRLKSPVLLVTGERSPEMFHVITDELAQCIPHHERIELPGAGHSFHTASPASYNEKVLTFLKKL